MILLFLSLFILFWASFYLLLQRTLLRLVMGLNLLGGAVNLLIFLSGNNGQSLPPFILPNQTQVTQSVADPVPQALILTAIVIGFAMIAFFVVAVQKTYAKLGVDDTHRMDQGDYL